MVKFISLPVVIISEDASYEKPRRAIHASSLYSPLEISFHRKRLGVKAYITSRKEDKLIVQHNPHMTTHHL